jgi:sugar (pentulose or hexulose) kinase
MHEAQNYLIFDFGASNCRTIAASYNGKTFSMDVTHRFENRPVFAAGTLYWDILSLYSELKKGISISLRKYPGIKSIGIDAWGADFGMLDKNGKLIANPVHYRDRKREEDAKDLLKIISAKKLYELTGASIIPLFDVFHLFSLKKQKAPEIINGHTFLTIADIFNYFLTDISFNEVTRLTTSAFYNQWEKKIEKKIFDILSLPKDIFPKTVNSGEIIGPVSRGICRELEINPLEIIAPATHDTASAEAGLPVKYPDKTWAFISIGTWGCFGIETEKPIATEETFRSKFLNEAGVAGINLFVRNINALWIIQQCMEKWQGEKEKNFSWSDIDRLYPASQPFQAFINVEDPEFLPASSDMPAVINEYCRKTGQKELRDIGEFSRVFYESLVLRIKYHFIKFQDFTEKKIDILHAVGGGIKNTLFCKWISDALQVPVITGPVETTAVGNLLMQLKAAGEIDDIRQGRKISLDSSHVSYYEPDNTEVWDQAFEKYLKII